MNEYLVSCKNSWLYGKIKAIYGGDRECLQNSIPKQHNAEIIRANMKRAEAMA